MVLKSLFYITVTACIINSISNYETTPESTTYPQPEEIPKHTSDIVFFIFPKECFERFMKFDFSVDCFVRIMSNGMSLAIVVFSLYYKVPQIMKILSEKSAKGIAPSSVVMEIMAALCGIAYYFYLDYEFMAYGEMVSGMVQSLIILSLCYIYKEVGTTVATIYFGLIVASIAGIYYKMLPLSLVNSLLLLSSIIFILSRITLILNILKTKTSGSLSFITLFLSMTGILVRLFTTFINLGDDKFLLLIITLNALFSSLLFFVALAYKKPEKLKAN